MRRLHLGTAVLATLSLSWTTYGYQSPNYQTLNHSSVDLLRAQLSLMDDRPDGCPAWYDATFPQTLCDADLLTLDSFNCLLPAFDCGQYSDCNQFNGKCDCPPGFGGDDCLSPGMYDNY